MPRVIVCGSPNAFTFAVVDATNPAILPPAVQANPMIGGGCTVDDDGPTAVAGNLNGTQVRLFDLTDPHMPVAKGIASARIASCGAVAIHGNLLAVGELQNPRITLFDITDLNNPRFITTFATQLPSFNSLAFVGQAVVVGAGQTDPHFVKVDFSNPMMPQQTPPHDPQLGGSVTVDADPSLQLIAAVSIQSGQVKLFDQNLNEVASVDSGLPGVMSVSLSGRRVFVGSQISPNVSLIDFAAVPPATVFPPFNSMVGNATVAFDGQFGACAAVSGSPSLKLFDLTRAQPNLIGSLPNVGIASVTSMKIQSFQPVLLANIAASPPMLAFGTVRVSTPKDLQVQIRNTGQGALTVNTIQTSDRRYTVVNAPANLNLAPGNAAMLTVRFTPDVAAPINASLTMATNVPNLPVFSVGLAGTGAVPQIVVNPSVLDFGNVPVCLTGTLSFSIANNGGVDLTIFSISSPGGPFQVAGPAANTAIAPGSTRTVMVTFAPMAPGQANQTLNITSDDPAIANVQVTLTGVGNPPPPPAIAVNPMRLDFGRTAVQFWTGMRLTIVNTGPCQDLMVTLRTSGMPFFVTDDQNPQVPPMPQTIGATIPGNGSKGFVVVFGPTMPGQSNGVLTITSNDPNNQQIAVPLTGSGVQLAPVSVELVLDRSGSMAGSAPGGTKMDALKAAVHLFANLLIPGQGDSIGSVEFDDAFNLLTPRATYDAAQQTAINSGVDTLTPRNFTSIGGGLRLSDAQLAGAFTARKIILIFTDGLENTPPMIADVEPQILGAGREVYAIGLGQPPYISATALAELAASAQGKFFVTDDTLVLRKNFVQVLADSFRQNMAADPIFSLSPGQPIEVPVAITECERRISFALMWEDPASQIEMEVRAPDGTRFTPTSPRSNQLVRYGQSSAYRFYQVGFPPVGPGPGRVIGPAQIGQWVMRITPVSLAGSIERCATAVILETDLQLQASVRTDDIYSPMLVQAKVLHNGAPVRGARVVLTLGSPTKSLSQVLTPAVIRRAHLADRNPIRVGERPLIGTRIKKYVLQANEDGTYGLKLPAPGIDGVYHFAFQAVGQACGGQFERYTSVDMAVGRKADGRRTKVLITFVDPRAVVVTVTPRDNHGKLLGAGLCSTIVPSVKGGTVLGVLDNLDGSYTIRVTWLPRKPRPKGLALQIGKVSLDIPLKVKRRRDG
jgi:hypothetical protein